MIHKVNDPPLSYTHYSTVRYKKIGISTPSIVYAFLEKKKEAHGKPLDNLFFYPDALSIHLKPEDLPLEILFLQKLVYLFRLVLRRKDHNSRPRS